VGLPFTQGRAAIVAAHPDDETVGLGGSFSRIAAPLLIHLTDGAPRDMVDAAANGFSKREDYAAARRQELVEALQAGGVIQASMVALGCVDQEASLRMVELARDLARLFRCHGVETVFTHAYEGGHPDHDAAAFAVNAACQSLDTAHRPQIVEFTSYHARSGEFEAGSFLPEGDAPETEIYLDTDALRRKTSMLACYRTQQATLQYFKSNRVEKFRPAPEYDFSQPARSGRLFYERVAGGMTADRWLSLAATARKKLGL